MSGGGAPKQKRKIDVATKLRLAQEAKASSINAVAKLHDVARENVRRWIRSEAQLAQLAQQQRDAPAYRLQGGGRRISYAPMDQELADKVFAYRANGVRVTRRMVAEWAEEAKTRMQVDVVVCPTWVSRFMARHSISLCKDGAIAPSDSVAPDQQKSKRIVVSAEDKLAIMYFFENSNRDMQKTLLQFYGPIDDAKVKQVKARNIYNWLHKRDEIATQAEKERVKKAVAEAALQTKSASRGVPPRLSGGRTAALNRDEKDGDGDDGENSSGVDNDDDDDGDVYENLDEDVDEEEAPLDGRTYGFGGDEDGDEDDEGNGLDEERIAKTGRAATEATAITPLKSPVFQEPPPTPQSAVQQPQFVTPPPSSQSRRSSVASRRTSSTSKKRKSLSSEQQQEQPSPSSAIDTDDVEDEELVKRKREIKTQQAELKARKEQLLVESIRCNNILKRIKIAEENMLARKRLRDAGVSQEEIDELLPAIRMNT